RSPLRSVQARKSHQSNLLVHSSWMAEGRRAARLAAMEWSVTPRNIEETLSESTGFHRRNGLPPGGSAAIRPRRPPETRSDVEVGNECGVFLDELEAGLWPVAHQAVDGGAGVVAVLQHAHLQQRARPRIHGGFAQMRVRHLAQPLEAGD